MKNLYYNIQLASTFLLERVKIFYLFLAFLVYGISYFPILFCEEEIISSAEKLEQTKKNDNLWIDIAILTTISIVCLYLICKGMPPANGSDTPSTTSSFDTETEKSNPKSDWKVYQANMIETRGTLQNKIEELRITKKELGYTKDMLNVIKNENTFLQQQNTALKMQLNYLDTKVQESDALISYLKQTNPKVVETALDNILEDSFPGSTSSRK